MRLPIAALVFACSLAPVMAAAAPDAAPRGGDYASIAKLPDFSGAWETNGFPNANKSASPIPFTPKYQKILDVNRRIQNAGGDILANSKFCIPGGMDTTMEAPTRVYEYLYAPGQILIIPQDNSVRRIFTDGRPHPAQPRPSFNGHSIGHWEGQVLVVDTVGLRRDGEIIHGMLNGDAASDMHIVERIYIAQPKQMRIDTTMVSSIAFVKPYARTITYNYVPFEVEEEVCAQNNRDLDEKGNQTFNPIPPPLDR